MSQFRGSVAIIIAITLGIVLIILVSAAALGVEVGELTRDAALGAIGAMVGALITYMAKS